MTIGVSLGMGSLILFPLDSFLLPSTFVNRRALVLLRLMNAGGLLELSRGGDSRSHIPLN